MDAYEQSKVNTVRYKKVKALLLERYGYDQFRSKQYEIINRLINGQDVLGIMPTGGGKSLCYQIPVLYRQGLCVVIFPLKALMYDQKLILDKLGLTSCCYNGDVTNKEIMLEEIIEGNYQFIFTTPESLGQLKYFLQKLHKSTEITLVAIDEAHCISSYGHDFRPKYRELGMIKEILPDVPILAVTATATAEIMEDIKTNLKISVDPIVTSFDRPNLYLSVKRKSKDMLVDILPIIRKHENQAVIIYCVTKKDTERVADLLNSHGIECGMYHSEVDMRTKERIHTRFIKDKLKIVSATIAFGMGINKPDVRAVIHYGAPKTVSGYYQEIGRAGRDGKPANCYMFFNGNDFVKHERMLDGSTKKHKTMTKEQIEEMKIYSNLTTCRRKFILAHFEEYIDKPCNNCDNCCEDKTVPVNLPTIKQDVNAEAQMIINLIDSLDKRFGMCMYIDILRGSGRKAITETIKKNEYYGKGKHKSVDWWKELFGYLLTKQYLQYTQVSAKMQVIETTCDGSTWASLSGLNVIDCDPLEPLSMKRAC